MIPRNQFVRTHLQARIKLAGRNIGHARLEEFAARHDYGTEAVHGIGDYLPAEHVNLKFRGQITLRGFMIRKADLVALGIAALGAAILTQDSLTFDVYDPTTGASLRTYIGCTVSDYSENYRAGQICGEDATLLFQDVVADLAVYSAAAPDPSNLEVLGGDQLLRTSSPVASLTRALNAPGAAPRLAAA